MLLVFVDELISIPKIIGYSPVTPLGCEKNPYLSNAMPYPEYLHLSISAFLVELAAPNKEFSSVG